MRRLPALLLACLALLLHTAAPAQTPPAEAPPAKVRLALLPGAPAVDAAAQDSLLTWVSTFQDVIYRMRIRDYLEMVNWDALIDKSYAGEPVKPDAAKLRLLKKSMLLASERMFPMLRPMFLFKDAEIRRIDLSAGNAVIIARTHDEDDAEYKLRWWLQQKDGQWQMTDFENVTVNMRFSALLQMGFQAAASQQGFRKDLAAKLVEMGQAMQDGETDKAYVLLKDLEASKLPPTLTEMFLVAKAGLLSQMDGKEAELAAALNDLEKTAPDNPVLYLLRASASYAASDYKNTIAWAEKIGASVGHDADTWSMLADSHQQLNHDAEYLATAQAWAADYPNSVDALWTLWQALPESQREAKLKPLLEQLTPAEDSLVEFADNATLEDDAPALKLVITIMQSRKVSAETVKEHQDMLQEMLKEQKDVAKKKE